MRNVMVLLVGAEVPDEQAIREVGVVDSFVGPLAPLCF